MPNGDRTGPDGRGPMTGRGMGYCNGFQTPGFMNSGFGRGFRRGFGRRWSQRFSGVEPSFFRPAQPTKEEEVKMLETELKNINEDKQAIEKRLKELK